MAFSCACVFFSLIQLCLLRGLFAASGLVSHDNEPMVTLRMGVVLTKGATGQSAVIDYDILDAAIDLAVHHVRLDYNIAIEPYLSLYPGNCVEDALDGLNRTVRALEQDVDFMLGPGCTGDLVMAAKLTTIYRVPLLTGAGHYLDSTDAWPYMTRFAYNTMTQWRFFLLICQQFNWTNVAVIYEADWNNTVTLRGGQSMCLVVLAISS